MHLLIFLFLCLQQVIAIPAGNPARSYKWPDLDWHLKYEAGDSGARYFDDLAELKSLGTHPGGKAEPQPWNLHALDCGSNADGIPWLVTTYMTSCTNPSQRAKTHSFYRGIDAAGYAKTQSVSIKLGASDNFATMSYQLHNNKLSHLMVWPRHIFHDPNIPDSAKFEMKWDDKLTGKVLRCGTYDQSRIVRNWYSTPPNGIYSIYGRQGDRLDSFGVFSGPLGETGICPA